MSMGNLGGATFNVTANIAPFTQGMALIQANAQKTAASVNASLGSMASMSESQFKGMAMGMMQVGYVADDLQYGFRSIVNNIQPIGMAAGRAFGMAAENAMMFSGVVGIAAVGVNLLVTHWDGLMDRLNSVWSGKTVEQLELLRERSEKAAEAFDKIGRPKAEREEASRAGGVIAEADRDRLAHQLGQAIGADPGLREEMTWQEERIIRGAEEKRDKGLGNQESVDMIREQFNQRLIKANRKKAEELIGQATMPGPEGEAGRLAIRRLAPKLEEDLKAATPEGQKRQKDFEKNLAGRERAEANMRKRDAEAKAKLEERLAAGRRLIAAREEKKAKNDTLVDALNAQGIGGEEAAEAERDRNKALDERDMKERLRGIAQIRKKEKDEREAIERGQQSMVNQQLGRDIRTPERGQASFSDPAQFAKMMQVALFDKQGDLLKKQLEVLNQIRQNTAQNVAGQGVMGAAGVAALAVGMD